MDFLRQHLPGLHQALRGALDSLSTFVSYLMGDEVPTIEREVQPAEELGVVASGKPGKSVEEEAQEVLHSLRGSQSEGLGVPRGAGEAGGHQEESSAAERVWGWGEGSSSGSPGGRQDAGAWEAGTAVRVFFGAEKTSEAESGAHRGRSSQAEERQDSEEQEVNGQELLRTWEQEEEEEEEVRAREPGMARGAESEQPWHREPKWKAAAERDKVAPDSGEMQPVVRGALAETEVSDATRPQRERGELLEGRAGQCTGPLGTQCPGAESEDWTALHKEEARTTLGKEEARETTDREGSTALARVEAGLLGVRETEDRPVPGDRSPEATNSIRVLEEASKRDQEQEPDEETVDKVKVFFKQPWALVTEATEEPAEAQKTRREAIGAQEPEQEAGDHFGGRTSQHGQEAQGRESLEVRAGGSSLLEETPAQESLEKNGSHWTPEAELAPDKKAEGEADSEAALEARPEEKLMWERGQEALTSREAQWREWGALQDRVPEGWAPELVEDAQMPPIQRSGCKGEHRRGPSLSKEETRSGKEKPPRRLGSPPPEGFRAEDGELWWRGDIVGKITQEGSEEAAGGQALEAEAEGGWKCELLEVPGWGMEEGTSVVESQGLLGNQGAEAGAGQVLGEPEPRNAKYHEVEAHRVPREGGWLEEVALSLQGRGHTQTSPLPTEMVGEQVAGQAGGPWGCEVREEARGGAEPIEAAQALLGGEAREWHLRVQRGHCEGQHEDQPTAGEAQRPLGLEDTKETDGQRTEAEGTAPDDLEAVQGQEGRPAPQLPMETAPGPSATAEAMRNGRGYAHSTWNEAMLPGCPLDVSVSRSRVLLSRNSSKRRLRPSFWRTLGPEQQNPASPQPDEELFAPQQRPPQIEEAPKPSPLKSRGTPELARRKLLGHGFGLAHPGMMQELQARLSHQKPQ